MDDTFPGGPDDEGSSNRQGGESWSLKAVWEGLVGGKLRIVESWVAAGHCFVTLRQLRTEAVACKHPDAVRRVLSGDAPKAVASDFAIPYSTIYCHSKRFQSLSSERPNAVGLPAFLAKAACAAGGATVASARSYGQDREGNVVLSIEMPVARLEKILSRAECDIAAGILEGRSTAEIRARRGTSRRTLANQICSIYRKLRVSGRQQLMATVLSDS